jgi:hypothetical protein
VTAVESEDLARDIRFSLLSELCWFPVKQQSMTEFFLETNDRTLVLNRHNSLYPSGVNFRKHDWKDINASPGTGRTKNNRKWREK